MAIDTVQAKHAAWTKAAATRVIAQQALEEAREVWVQADREAWLALQSWMTELEKAPEDDEQGRAAARLAREFFGEWEGVQTDLGRYYR